MIEVISRAGQLEECGCQTIRTKVASAAAAKAIKVVTKADKAAVAALNVRVAVRGRADRIDRASF